MKQYAKASLATAVSTAVFGAALVVAGTASAGITNTKHYLGAGGNGPNTAASGDQAEICIFCHTPHGGDTSAAVPLWNKQLVDPAHFTTYDQLGTSTLDAGVVDVGSVSLACLTCHDGTQAIDNILNDSGSGGYDATGGGTNGLGYTWTSTNNTLDANGAFQNSVDTGGTNIWEIGVDLRNDHPIGMQYGGGGVKSSTPNLGENGTVDTDFHAAIQIGTQDRWYVDNKVSGTQNVFDKWDFKLYTRDTSSGAGAIASHNGVTLAGEPEPFVECGSCHDPHLDTTTFLRIDPADNTAGNRSNDGSAVCLTCHDK
jgi:hypothetical protein